MPPAGFRLDGLEVVEGYLGRGYGRPTPEGNAAERAAGAAGFGLEPTYTAKTFAACLAACRAGTAGWTVLFPVTADTRVASEDQVPSRYDSP